MKELNDNLTGLLWGNKGHTYHTQIKMEISWLASVRSQGRALQPGRRTRHYVGEQEGRFCDKPSQAAQLQAAPTPRICQTTSPGNLCFVKLLRKCPGSRDSLGICSPASCLLVVSCFCCQSRLSTENVFVITQSWFSSH